MKLSDGVEWGVHVVTLLAYLPEGRALTSARLAEYRGVPAAYMAKHLQALSRAEILESVQGPRGGYRLARSAAEVTVLDVVEAIEGTEPAFRCTEIRRRGPGARPAREYPLPCAIDSVMRSADTVWRASLRAVTIADLARAVGRDAPPKSLIAGAHWIEEALR